MTIFAVTVRPRPIDHRDAIACGTDWLLFPETAGGHVFVARRTPATVTITSVPLPAGAADDPALLVTVAVAMMSAHFDADVAEYGDEWRAVLGAASPVFAPLAVDVDGCRALFDEAVGRIVGAPEVHEGTCTVCVAITAEGARQPLTITLSTSAFLGGVGDGQWWADEVDVPFTVPEPTGDAARTVASGIVPTFVSVLPNPLLERAEIACTPLPFGDAISEQCDGSGGLWVHRVVGDAHDLRLDVDARLALRPFGSAVQVRALIGRNDAFGVVIRAGRYLRAQCVVLVVVDSSGHLLDRATLAGLSVSGEITVRASWLRLHTGQEQLTVATLTDASPTQTVGFCVPITADFADLTISASVRLARSGHEARFSASWDTAAAALHRMTVVLPDVLLDVLRETADPDDPGVRP